MAEITTTQSFSDGDTVTATKLNNIQGNASIQPEAITNRTAEATIDQANDLLLIYDASATSLKKITPSNLIKAGTASDFPVTGNATIGGNLSVTGNSVVKAGTAASPAIQPTGDTNTGIFFPAADTIAFSEGGAEAMRIDSNGRVGIGSTSPARQLTLDHASAPEIGLYTSGTERVKLSTGGTAASQFCVDTGGAERLRIDSSGNVGIGTTSPAVKLDVSNGNIQGKEIFLQNAAASSPALGTTPSWYSPASGVAALSTNANERLRIDSSGNVGIGTTSPSQKLDIQSASASVQIKSTTATNSAILKIENNSTAYIGNETSSANSLFLGTTAYATCLGNVGAYPVQLATNNNVRMTIDSSGNVGIGTTPSGQKLDVNGGSVFRGTLFLGDGSSSVVRKITASTPLTFANQAGSAEMTIDSSGNVGIGATSLTSTLTVNKAGTDTVIQMQEGGTNTAQIESYQSSLYLNVAGANNIIFRPNSTERMRIDSSGNLLVGTTNSALTTGIGLKFIANASEPYMGYVMNTASNASNYHLYNTNATNNGYRFFVTTNGGISNFSANNTNLSDERLKTNISPAGNYLEKICSIQVKTFNYKDQGEDTEKTIGIIAQDVEAVIPELINNDGFGETPEDGIPLKTIYQTDIQYVLMRCIQELKAENDSLKSRIEALEAA